MSNQVSTFERYDKLYWTYTSQLDDQRLPAFINALTQNKPVSFRGNVFYIKRILLMEEKTIIVLRVIQIENKNKPAHVVKNIMPTSLND